MAASTGPPPDQEEQYIATFFCRALYDYQTADASSLSFHKNDIIEVLTRLDSGWWDGLLGDERGWFPSNYVTVITDQEAEAALNGSDFSASQPSFADESTVDMVDMAHSMSRALSQSDSEGDWLNGDAEFSNNTKHSSDRAHGTNRNPTQHSDFWVPQVSQDGRIFYVNTQTGQHSRDLPQEAEEDSDVDLAGLTASQSSARAGMGSELGFASPVNGRDPEPGITAGFGVPQRSHTPEPWVKRLADDGLSFYYMNTLDGRVSWTLPQSSAPPAYSDGTPSRGPPSSQSTLPSYNGNSNSRDMTAAPNRLRSGSSASQSRGRSSSADQSSFDSDDSDVQPNWRNRAGSTGSMLRHANGHSHPTASGSHTLLGQMVLTPPEQLARALQQTLSPPGPESPTELSNQVREAIASVMEFLQSASSSQRPEHFRELDRRVLHVVSTVRNLLYVTATPTGHVSSHLYPRDVRDSRTLPTGQTLQAYLKAAQRKVAGTLSKLVLSALAMQYDPGLAVSDKPSRIESDVTELERSVITFVMEVQMFQERHSTSQVLSKSGLKRLHGVFSTSDFGMGLPGAGAAASWKGLGYVLLDETTQPPVQSLTIDHVSEVKMAARSLRERLVSVATLVKRPDFDRERLRSEGQNLMSQLSSLLEFVGNIHIAQHVDVDGSRLESGHHSSQVQYMKTVETAQLLVRTLEFAMQSLYDDGATFFVSMQETTRSERSDEEATHRDFFDASTAALTSNAEVLVHSLEALLAVGQDQSNLGQGDYNESVERRRSRLAAAAANAADASPSIDVGIESEEEFVDMADALSRSGSRAMGSFDSAQTIPYYGGIQPSEPSLDYSVRSRSESVGESATPTWLQPGPPEPDTYATRTPPEMQPANALDDEAMTFIDDIRPSASKSPPRGAGAAKIMKILGDEAPQHYVDKLNADAKPWYLRPNYDQSEILMDPDGGVRAGTAPALVERLTAHEHGDPTFNQNFLMTFKSFMTIDELLDLLVRRFWITAPPNLTAPEFEEWTKWKQHVIRVRVLNTFKTMITDDGILEKEDMYILTRMKEFSSHEEVVSFAAAKQLLILIERAQRNGDAPIKTLNTVPLAPPAPILPRNSKKVKLLDIDPVELARQLTLMEATLYKKIRPMECLQRSRESKPGRTSDNISSMIQFANRMANWVADSVLTREDSRKRAGVVKHFISVADRCRGLQNYSTMTAIVSGLNAPPIRRLKRTWEQVNTRFMAQLRSCEATIDSAKNFNNYRSTLARITPPCVPFIGVYLTTLTFINDGAEDKLSGNMINFRKRQKAAEVIQDIKRWQSKPYNFQTVGTVLSYLEECFSAYSDGVDYGEQFWNLSLEREPREREDEKMARLLQESGFL